jgi:hypothetical protein
LTVTDHLARSLGGVLRACSQDADQATTRCLDGKLCAGSVAFADEI